MTTVILVIVGAIIGWVTNILAIKLLFRPLKPIKILGTPFQIVGLIPKRKADIAKNIGEVVANELLSIDDILDEAIQAEDKDRIKALLKSKISTVIDEKMNTLPSMFKLMVIGYVEELVEKELDTMLLDLTDNLKETISKRIDIATLVEHKIIMLDLKEMENMILTIAAKELKHIELLGLFLGGLIGLIQGLLLLYI